MRMRFVKYGKTIRHTGGQESCEVSIELEPEDFEEEAIHRAKDFVARHLEKPPQNRDRPLTVKMRDAIAQREEG